MHSRNLYKSFLCTLIASAFMSGLAMAADTATAVPPEPSKEVREKMAAAHDRMAACLRTDRTVSDCRDELMKACHQLAAEHGCPMMDKHQHMMKTPAPVPKTP
jgi:cytosine/adenosine deaminase-related metal-dependent hydrolase